MRWLKLTLLALLIVGVSVGGYWIYLNWSRGTERELSRAEKLYERGVKAYEANDGKTAQTHFADAVVAVEQFIKDVEAELKKQQEASDRSPEAIGKLLESRGKAIYLRARALRDLGYARYLMEKGEKIPEAQDPVEASGVYRPFNHPRLREIDQDESTFSNCNRALEAAAQNLPADPTVQYEMLRRVMSTAVENWYDTGFGIVSAENLTTRAYSKDILEGKAKPEARDAQILGKAHYFLARYKYLGSAKTEIAEGKPRYDLRHLKDLEQARVHVDQVKRFEGRPQWRTVLVEAQIAELMHRMYQQSGDKEKAQAELDRLRNLLFGQGEASAVGRAEAELRARQLGNLRGLDLDAVLEVHTMALRMTVAEYAGNPAISEANARLVRDLLGKTIAVAQEISGQGSVGVLAATEIAESIVQQARIAQRILAVNDFDAWRTSFQAIRELTEKGVEKRFRDAEESRARDEKAPSAILDENISVRHPSKKTVLQRQLAIMQSYGHLLMVQADFEGRRGQEETARELKAAAQRAVETCAMITRRRLDQLVRSADFKNKAADIIARESWEMHRLALELTPNMTAEQVHHRLQALIGSAEPRARAFADYWQGSRAWQEGKFEIAYSHLRDANANPALEADYKLPALTKYTDVAMALGQFREVIPLLDEVEKLVFDPAASFTPDIRDIIENVLGSPGDLYLRQVRARLWAAQQIHNYLRLVKEGRVKPDPKEWERLRQRIEEEAKKWEAEVVNVCLPKLRDAKKAGGEERLYSNQLRAARGLLMRYYRSVRDDNLRSAREELENLRRDYPDSVEVLADAVWLTMQEPKVDRDALGRAVGMWLANPPFGLPNIASSLAARQALDAAFRKHVHDADKLIDDFLARNPNDELARLLKAEWLGATNRVDEAIDYLEAWKNVSDKYKTRYTRILAHLYLRNDIANKRSELLQHLQLEPGEDPSHLFIGRTPDEIQALLRENPDKFNRGLVLVNQGLQALALARDPQENAELRYEEAATAFYQALDYTRLRPLARANLQEALFLLADQRPVRAEELARQWHRERSARPEPEILLPLAYAHLKLENIGRPGDPIERSVNMSSALGAWETAHRALGRDPMQAFYTRITFWRAAGRPDIALAYVEQLFSSDPGNAAAKRLAAELSLESFDPQVVQRGFDRLDGLRKENKSDPVLMLIEGRYLLKLGQEAKATRLYEEFLQKHDNYSEPYFQVVALWEKAGDLDRARRWLAVWRHHLPDDLNGLSSAVRLLAAENKVADAIGLAERERDRLLEYSRTSWMKLEPKKAPGAQELERRKKTWKKAMEDGLEADVLKIYSHVLMGLQGAKKFKEAETWYRSMDAKLLSKPAGQLLLANLYMVWLEQEKDTAEVARLVNAAYEIYDRLHRAKPGENRLAANNMAMLMITYQLLPPDDPRRAAYKDKYDPANALKALWQSFTSVHLRVTGDRMPDDFLDTFGLVYKCLGDKLDRDQWVEMRDLFEAAVERHRFDPRLYYFLAYAYMKLENLAEARRYLGLAASRCETREINRLPKAKRDALLKEIEKLQASLPRE